MTKIAIVVQRYGQEIIGGAESHCRLIAERLAAKLGWDVTIYTSTAFDYVTWKNTFKTGQEMINGVRVKRFPVLFPRHPKIFGLYNHKITPVILRLAGGKRLARLLGRILERLWIVLQGPYCPTLVQALRKDADQYDKLFFFTYLYFPTIFGAAGLKGRNFALIPTAHREPPFYFQHMRKLLLSCHRIIANTIPEKHLIESRVGMALPNIRLAGIGFDVPADSTSDSQPQPYILYLGRICEGKGVGFLLKAFQTYLKQFPESKLRLVLVGKKDEDFNIPNHERIQYLGFVDDERKFSLIRSSSTVVNPSQYESMSMIAIEAMVCLKPLLLNQNSEVLHYYCQINDTCFGYSNEEEFVERLARIDQHHWSSPDNMERLLKTKRWAEQNYSWEAVTNAYVESPNQFIKTGSTEHVIGLNAAVHPE